MTNYFDPTTGQISHDEKSFKFSFGICAGWVPYHTMNGVYIGHRAGNEYRLPNGFTVDSYYKLTWCLGWDMERDYKINISVVSK